MATKKVHADEKLTDTDFPLFPALDALDKKDYDWFDKLTEEQKKKFSSFMMTHWMSTIKSTKDLQSYYLQSVNHYANKYLLNETINKHVKLQWLMLCAASPNMGKQFHQWIPHIRQKVSMLEEEAKTKEIKEYYKKIYPKADDESLSSLSEEYVRLQKRKVYLAEEFPNMKFSDIEALNELVSDLDIKTYEKQKGN
jgi:hypothetical protein